MTRAGSLIALCGLAAAMAHGASWALAASPSVDCAKARAPVERTICGDHRLSVLDVAAAQALEDLIGAAPAKRSGIMSAQRAWLGRRLAACAVPARGSFSGEAQAKAAGCLKDQYRDRIRALRIALFAEVGTPARRALGATPLELAAPFEFNRATVLRGRIDAAALAALMDVPLDFSVSLAPASGSTNPDDWVKVATCRDWIRRTTDGWVAMDNMDMIVSGEFSVRCDTLRILSAGGPASVSFLPETGLGDIRLYSPIILGDDEAFDRSLAKGGRSFGDLERRQQYPYVIRRAGAPMPGDGHDDADEGDVIVIEQDEGSMAFSIGGFVHSLALIARGDFNGDGVEDFLVRYEYQPIAGSLHVIGPLVLSRLAESAAITPVEGVTKP